MIFDPVVIGGGGCGEYMSIRETAVLMGCSPKTISNKIALGIFREGEHYTRPLGGRLRFLRRVVVALMEGKRPVETSDETPAVGRAFAGLVA